MKKAEAALCSLRLVVVRCRSLEEDLQSELHLPWWVGSGDRSEAAAGRCYVEVGVVGAVEHVEHVPLELALHALFSGEGLREGRVNLLQSRAFDRSNT